MSLPTPPDDRSAKVLEAVYALFVLHNTWPQFVDLDRYLDQRGEPDTEDVLLQLPRGLVYGVGPHSPPIRDDQEVALSVAAMTTIEGAGEDLALYLEFVRLAVALEADRAPGDPEPRLSPAEIASVLEAPAAARPDLLARLGAILMVENWGWTGFGWDPDWSVTFDRRVRRFRGVSTIEEYWTRAHPAGTTSGRSLGLGSLILDETIGMAPSEVVMSHEVFVVHGRDHLARDAVVRVIAQMTKRNPTILDKQANMGRTVIEKFEDYAGRAGAAVVILSPDDEGRLRDHGSNADLAPRARQNVLFELGWFYANLGRKRVIALLVGDVEWPSDIHGVLYERLDSRGRWKHRLGKELMAAGIGVDLDSIE